MVPDPGLSRLLFVAIAFHQIGSAVEADKILRQFNVGVFPFLAQLQRGDLDPAELAEAYDLVSRVARSRSTA